MVITVLGATGPTGSQIVQQALSNGHRVRALVRHPERLTVHNDALDVITGDATSPNDLTAALQGSTAVLSALGAGSDRKSTIASRAGRALVETAGRAGVSRVVVMSAFGVGASLRHASGLQHALISLAMKNLFADKDIADRELRASDLDWTLVYPVALTNGPATGAFRTWDADADIPRISVRSRVSRADVAAFMLEQLDNETWVRRTAILA